MLTSGGHNRTTNIKIEHQELTKLNNKKWNETKGMQLKNLTLAQTWELKKNFTEKKYSYQMIKLIWYVF